MLFEKFKKYGGNYVVEQQPIFEFDTVKTSFTNLKFGRET